MMKTPDLIFRDTLRRLEVGFTVSMIATGRAKGFDVECQLADVAGVMRESDFSQVVVTSDDSVIGVVEDSSLGGDLGDLRASDRMTVLRGDMLVSANSALRSLIKSLAHNGLRYRLVVGAEGEIGIVTRTDLLELPVRLLLFSYIAHLESLLEKSILAASPGDAWMGVLGRGTDGLPSDAAQAVKNSVGKKAVDSLIRSQESHKQRGDTPYLIQLTQFPQKWFAAYHIYSLGSDFANEMTSIQWDLRNLVAHSGDYVSDNRRLVGLEQRLGLCEKWISHFTEILNGDDSTIPSLAEISQALESK